ncbi:MAG: uracil-DNA glycosylase [Terriglobia bacterium]
MRVEKQLAGLNRRVVNCRKCARLVRYREKVARAKRRMFRDWDYWGRPVPGFGDPRAKLLVLGLAPAAHGGNRTGRVFTGDRSGDFLFGALYDAGFANQANSDHREDGLKLRGAYVTAGVRCCPPKNRPTRKEQRNCRAYLEEEFRLLTHLRAVLALGRIAHDTYLRLLKDFGQIERLAAFPFAHGAQHELPAPKVAGASQKAIRLFDSFHPSQQNTQSGRLTPAMFSRVLRQVRDYLRG